MRHSGVISRGRFGILPRLLYFFEIYGRTAGIYAKSDKRNAAYQGMFYRLPQRKLYFHPKIVRF